MSTSAPPTPDVVELAEALIAVPSVTPAAGLVFDRLEAALRPLGFAVHRFFAGAPPDGPVENLFAIRKGPAAGRHFAFAGHVDVVPPGDGWTSPAFAPARRGEMLYGRGAVDMKGAIAAMLAAAAQIPREAGTLSFIITGDEEGPATFGTRELIRHMRAVAAQPDLILVGEPTSVSRLGDTIKIGRRGSLNAWLEVTGREGHVAYPHLADNACTRLVALLGALGRLKLDAGTEWFQPSNLEITEIIAPNPATNVIPARAAARISIRFNDQHTGQALARRIERLAKRHGATARVVVYGEAFLTPAGAYAELVRAAIRAETGLEAALSTSGGTSDARFLKDVAPTIEFGLANATMHKRDEAVVLADLATLAAIYRRIAEAVLAG